MKRAVRSAAAAFLLAIGIEADGAVTSWRKTAEWDIKHVAMLREARDLPGAPGPVLLGTCFGPFGSDEVFAVANLSTRGQEASVVKISSAFKWPNELAEVPASVGLKGTHLTVADGFLFPWKRSGGIHLLNVTEGLGSAAAAAAALTITETKNPWFYHHAEWLDVDGDGVQDLLAARATKPILWGKPDGELVWAKHFGGGSFGDTEVLVKGPGVGFHVVDFHDSSQHKGGLPEIVATEFFKDHMLAIYSCPEETWATCSTKNTTVKTVIDSHEGPFFASQIVDLNGDGRKDILATAQQGTDADGQKIAGRVLAYEMGSSNGVRTWERHLLADGYAPHPKVPSGSGSPGNAVAFQPDAAKGGKPHIVVSGDDGGVVDVLVPSSKELSDWEYSKETIYKTDKTTGQGVSTIGTVLVMDVDSSGKPELFIASYAENKLLMMTSDSDKEQQKQLRGAAAKDVVKEADAGAEQELLALV